METIIFRGDLLVLGSVYNLLVRKFGMESLDTFRIFTVMIYYVYFNINNIDIYTIYVFELCLYHLK